MIVTEHVLRRALVRAGIVLGYEHICRRKACGHRTNADDGECADARAAT
jgi:integrase